MKVGIYCNATKNGADKAVISAENKLKNEGIDFVRVNDLTNIEKIDVLMVLGGDGTILRTVKTCSENSIKIIGINLGTLGFLTEFEKSEIDMSIELLKSGNYVTDKRRLINLSFKGESYTALNDVVVQRIYEENITSQVVRLSAYMNGRFIDNFVCDGLIASTPTGSTAYSLASGGAILTPDIHAFTLTPICSHSLRSKPIIFPDKNELVITLKDNESSVAVFCDGKMISKVNADSEIKITVADKVLYFIRKRESNFFDRLNKKLSNWSNN